MGIKGLNKWLKTNISNAFLQRIPQIHTLFIDAKQFYYKSLDLVPESQVIPIFLGKIQKIIETYTPTDSLFLAMDGPNPAAKFQTQRERKFQRDYKEDFHYPTEEQFEAQAESEHYAEAVNQALIQFLQGQIDRPDINSKEFLFSSGYAAGESEHKYFQYFRAQKMSRNWTKNRNHFIVSNDNDLIFLSLQFLDEKFYIIKIFEFNNEEKIEFVDISAVRHYFLNSVYQQVKNKNNFNDEKIINDIISLSFLLGNDFIPPFPEIESVDVRSFQRLLNSYSALNNNNDTKYNYLIEKDSFNVDCLRRFISILFRNDYRKFQNNFDQNQLKEASQLILRTLNFTWIYYSKGCPSWSFYYPFLEAPSLKLAVPLMQQESSDYFIPFLNEEKVQPFLKTLITRPAYSTSNIPWIIYKIKIPPSKLASKYWPLIKPTDKVPIFDLKEITEAYKSALPSLKKEDADVFNRCDPPYFIYTKNSQQSTNTNNQQDSQNSRKKKPKNDRFHFSYE